MDTTAAIIAPATTPQTGAVTKDMKGAAGAFLALLKAAQGKAKTAADAGIVVKDAKADAKTKTDGAVAAGIAEGVAKLADGAKDEKAAQKDAAATTQTKAETAAALAATLIVVAKNEAPAAVTAEAAANAAAPANAPESKPRTERAAKRDAADGAKTERVALRNEPKADTATTTVTADPAPKPADTRVEAPKMVAADANGMPAATPAMVDQFADTDTAAPQGMPGTVESRIPLSRETAAQTGIAAPVLALRVHTKDGNTKAIEIRLDPPGLGQVDVKLETDSDGRLRAVLSTERSDAFELLKRESGALEAALREAGVDLGENGLSFSLNDGAYQEASARDAYHGATGRRDAALDQIAPETLTAAQPAWRDGLIDIQV